MRDRTGSNLVEAALLTPLLVLLTLAVVDFGGLFYCYLALEHAVSEASRYGITGNVMNDPSGTAMTRQASIIAAARNATPLTLADGAFSFSHMTPGASSWTGGTGVSGDIDKVTVTYNWTLMTPLLRMAFTGGQITLRAESAMKNETRFQ
ncbi:MAG TPA: TadE/TadG family type IV pilus assembly protein [Vicinamibacterales bacterium]